MKNIGKVLIIFAITFYIFMYNTGIWWLLSIFYVLILLITRKMKVNSLFFVTFIIVFAVSSYISLLSVMTCWPEGTTTTDILKYNAGLALLRNFNVKFSSSIVIATLVNFFTYYIKKIKLV